MSILKSYLTSFKKYAIWNGRASRYELAVFMLTNVMLGIILHKIDVFLGTTVHFSSTGRNTGILCFLFDLLMILPTIAVAVRRMHDINIGAKWIFITNSFYYVAYI